MIFVCAFLKIRCGNYVVVMMMAVALVFGATSVAPFQPNSADAQVDEKSQYVPVITWHTVSHEGEVLGLLSITDTSMNLNPDERDTFEVKFWSEDDPVEIVIPVRETSSNSGKFEFYPKNVLLSDHFDSKENKLHISEDHSIWMSYVEKSPLLLIDHFKMSHDNSVVNKPSPVKQLKWLQSIDKNLSGNLENIGCNSDLHLIQNTLTEKIACVKLFTMEKLIQRGDWRDVHSSMKHSDISNISISTDKSSYEIGSDMIVTIVDQSQNTDDHYADTINIDVLEWTVFSDSREILSVNIADDPIVFDPEPSWPRETGDDSDTFLIVMRVPEKIGDIMLEEGQQVRLTYNVEIPAVHVNPSVTFALTAECVSGKYSEEEQIKIKCYPEGVPTVKIDTKYIATVGTLTTFSAQTSLHVEEIKEYLWDFGDGTFGSDSVTSHAYSTSGPKKATLTIIDNNNLSFSTSHDIVIYAPKPSTAKFEVVSSCNLVIKGTWVVDIEACTLENSGDLQWKQFTNSEYRYLMPHGNAQAVNLGIVDFDSITDPAIYHYSDKTINGGVSNNSIPSGTVVLVKTVEGNYAKMLVEKYGYNLTVKIDVMKQVQS